MEIISSPVWGISRRNCLPLVGRMRLVWQIWDREDEMRRGRCWRPCLHIWHNIDHSQPATAVTCYLLSTAQNLLEKERSFVFRWQSVESGRLPGCWSSGCKDVTSQLVMWHCGPHRVYKGCKAYSAGALVFTLSLLTSNIQLKKGSCLAVSPPPRAGKWVHSKSTRDHLKCWRCPLPWSLITPKILRCYHFSTWLLFLSKGPHHAASLTSSTIFCLCLLQEKSFLRLWQGHYFI